MAEPGDPFDFNILLEESMRYSDAHRGVLRMLIDRGSMSEKAMTVHYIRCFADIHYLDEVDHDENRLNLKNVTEGGVEKMTKQLFKLISSKVEHMGMRLMRARDEVKGKKMVVIVSENHYTEHLAAASPYDKNELYLAISWLDEMLKPENDGYISITNALKSAGSLPVPMKMDKAQVVVDELFSGDWVRREAGDYLTLTTRALTELGPILRSRYHCATCALCSNVTIRKASMVSCDSCDCLLHIWCWRNFASGVTGEKAKCPYQGCTNKLDKADFEEQIKQIIAARANPDPKKKGANGDAAPPKKPVRKNKPVVRSRSSFISDVDDDDDEILGEDAVPKPKRQKSARRARATISSDDDEEMGVERSMQSTQKTQRRRGRSGSGARDSTSRTDPSEENVQQREKEDDGEEEDDDEVFVRKSQKHPRRSSTAEKQPRKKSKEEAEAEDD